MYANLKLGFGQILWQDKRDKILITIKMKITLKNRTSVRDLEINAGKLVCVLNLRIYSVL